MQKTAIFNSYLFLPKWKRFWIICLTVSIIGAYAISDFYGPLEIILESDSINGLNLLRSEGEELLVKNYDSKGNLWATRGMWAYRLKPDDQKFERQYHIPTGFSIFWLRNFSIVRRLTKRPECVELMPNPDGSGLAMSAGRIWYRSDNGTGFNDTMKMRHYGIGIGRGFRNNGWDEVFGGNILYGEYLKNNKRTNVRLYCSDDNGKTLSVTHEYYPGQIRHIHAVQQDPFSRKALILAGDLDHESMISWTDDCGITINPIGYGEQKWRATQLVFTKTFIFWGADTPNPRESGIYRWDRKTHTLEKLNTVEGEIYYATRLEGGTIVMSTVRTGAKNEKDDKTRLWIIRNGENITPIVFGRRDSFAKKAKLHFQRRQGSSSLALSV